MGLDMYLCGEEFFWTNWEHPEKNLKKDGFKVTGMRLELGYWRKHPNLHGFIVKEFADGVDECQEIELTQDDLLAIIKATKEHNLPATEGFFFGESSAGDDEPTIEIIQKALAWLNTEQKGISKSVKYRASW